MFICSNFSSIYLSCRNVFFKEANRNRVVISNCVYLSNFSLVGWGFLLFVGFFLVQLLLLFVGFGLFVCFLLKNSCSLNLMDILKRY